LSESEREEAKSAQSKTVDERGTPTKSCKKDKRRGTSGYNNAKAKAVYTNIF
jgi:hypothetical protein